MARSKSLGSPPGDALAFPAEGAGSRRASLSARNTRSAEVRAATRITRNNRFVTRASSAGGITPTWIANRLSTVSFIPRATVEWKILESRVGRRQTFVRIAVEGHREAQNTPMNA